VRPNVAKVQLLGKLRLAMLLGVIIDVDDRGEKRQLG
jgi:hypothetical protein